MGNAKIRRLLKNESKWTDKSCVRHKHIFSQPCFIKLEGDRNRHIPVLYYRVLKCEHCNSFIEASYVDEPNGQLPVYLFEKPHYMLGFDGIKFIKEEK